MLWRKLLDKASRHEGVLPGSRSSCEDLVDEIEGRVGLVRFWFRASFESAIGRVLRYSEGSRVEKQNREKPLRTPPRLVSCPWCIFQRSGP